MKRQFLTITALIAALFLTALLPAAADGFEILPDYHLTQRWVKAGAYFRNNGQRVKVDRVTIHVTLPVSPNGSDFNYETREHRETNVGEPDWSGWWDEPWRMGFFHYTVTADYAGRQFKKTFVVGRNKGFEALETAAGIAKKIAEALAN